MNNKKKTAVMYGAGNIGRGFIGQIFHDSGFEVVFIDVNADVVSALNDRGSYIQIIIDGNAIERCEITGVRAVDGHDREAVSHEMAECEIMAVSVGAAVLPHIAPFLAEGFTFRTRPLNILVCENLIHAPAVLRDHVSGYLTDLSVLDKIGFAGATIGRMVPVMSLLQRADDPTVIAVERFCTLPVDADAVIRPMPELLHTVYCTPFAFEEGKKLYIHNMGHALTAYFGALSGYTYIWQAIEDDSICSQVRDAMMATAQALAGKYDESLPELTAYVDDLLVRFANKGLGDTIARVGADPLRKLAPGDRLLGAIDLCREQGTDYSVISAGVSAAQRYDGISASSK